MSRMNDKRKKNVWLIKFAPFRTAWPEIVRRGTFTLRGVRSPEARNNLKAMKKGDPVLFYQSQRAQAVVGLMEVSRTAYPDPTSTDPQWLTCDFCPVRTFPKPVSLAEIKADPGLADSPLIRRPRLSVMPLSTPQYQQILSHSEGAGKRVTVPVPTLFCHREIKNCIKTVAWATVNLYKIEFKERGAYGRQYHEF